MGLIPFVDYETLEYVLYPSEQLFIYSDGITECENQSGAQFDEVGLEEFFGTNNALTSADKLPCLMKNLTEFSGSDKFEDDISVVLIGLPDVSNDASFLLTRTVA